ncbi:MAG: hypothetical protein QM756_35220 [Polyangiaceae bacterium]
MAKWRAEQVPLNGAASAFALAELEDRLQVPLPHDIREFYTTAGGMTDYEYDPRHLSFWNLVRVLAEPPMPPLGEGTVREFAFGDALIESHYFVFRVKTDGRVVIGHDVDPTDEEPGLERFFRRYLDDPVSLPVIIL